MLLKYLAEQTIINSFGLFGALSLAAYVAGPFLLKLETSRFVRAAAYSVIGVLGGMWSHSFSLNGRSMEAFELIGLPLTMFPLAFVVSLAAIALRGRRRLTK